jgi:hypothetical protein
MSRPAIPQAGKKALPFKGGMNLSHEGKPSFAFSIDLSTWSYKIKQMNGCAVSHLFPGPMAGPTVLEDLDMKRFGGLTFAVAITLAALAPAPASAAGPFGHATAVSKVAGTPLVDVAMRRRSYGRRGGGGAAAAALIGAAIIGGAIIANSQPRRRQYYVDDGYYYDQPQPQYYYQQPAYGQQPYYGSPNVMYHQPRRHSNHTVDRPAQVYNYPQQGYRQRGGYNSGYGQRGYSPYLQRNMQPSERN